MSVRSLAGAGILLLQAIDFSNAFLMRFLQLLLYTMNRRAPACLLLGHAQAACA